MKKVLKFVLSNALAFILGAIIFGGIGIALAVSGIESETLSYTNEKNEEVENIKDALDYLYEKAPSESGINETLANYIINSLYTGTDGENGLYYHNGQGNYTNSTEEACWTSNNKLLCENSYRFAGSNSGVANNYVCFGAEVDANGACDSGHLYRIIGVFNKYFQDLSKEPEYQVKLIKSTFAKTTELGTGQNSGNNFYWQGTSSTSYNNTWSQSTFNTTALNNYYYNTYLDGINNSKWSRMIDTHTWKVGGNTWQNIGLQTVKTAYKNEILNPVTTYSKDSKTELDNKIGLIYESDYMYAALPTYWTKYGYNSNASVDYRAAKNDNWLYLGGSNEWTISRVTGNANDAFFVDSSGHVNGYYANNAYGVRPVFYLDSAVKISGGKGTIDEPWTISL